MPFRHFARIVRRVMRTLPPEFTPHIENLVVDIEDEPDLATLRRMGFTQEEIEDGDTLLGLYEEGGYLPARIRIFKRPLEEEFPDPKELEIEIRKTVIHELAHHFGFSERDLEKWDANPNPFGDEVQEGDD